MHRIFLCAIAVLGLSACAPRATPATAPPPAPTVPPTIAPTIPPFSTPTRVPTLEPTPTAIATPTMSPTSTPRANQAELDQALVAAAASGDVARIQTLLQGGANVNAQDGQGRTPAMAATYGNHVEAVDVLIKAGADVNIRDGMLNNPFLYAGAEGYLDILKLAHAAGADPAIPNRYGGVALIPASEHGYVDVVRFLLTETAIDVNHVNNLGWTALLEAIILSDGSPKQQETVRLLIEHGADVNIADKNGVTPLAHAKQRGFREIQALLEAAGAR